MDSPKHPDGNQGLTHLNIPTGICLDQVRLAGPRRIQLGLRAVSAGAPPTTPPWMTCDYVPRMAVWVYRQRGGAPRLNGGKMGRVQAAAGKGSAGGAPGRQGACGAMDSEQLVSAVEATRAADAAEDLRLLQCYEPVLRFTRGELFLPMAVEDYLEKCSLWRSAAAGGRGAGAAAGNGCARRANSLRLVWLRPARRSGGNLSLRFVQRSLGWREFRAWRRAAGRPRLAAGSQPARRRRPARPAHRRDAAVVAATAGARARGHRSGGRADLPVTGRPGQLPVLRPGHPRPGFRCVAVLVLVRDERLALDLWRSQRPRGRLGAGHRVPARPAGSIRPAGLGGVLLP